jgi:hypothetical protein
LASAPLPKKKLAERLLSLALALGGLSLLPLLCQAQIVTQNFTLQKGWNAIYLELSPTQTDPASLLAGIPVSSLWTHADRLASVDFIQTPDEQSFSQGAWLKWAAPPAPFFVNNLLQVKGRRAYLLKLTNGPVTWQVSGRLAARSLSWTSDAWNLLGFSVDPASPPSFRTFFQCSTNHYDVSKSQLRGAYRLGTNGIWSPVDPTALMKAGEACWIYCKGASAFTGPLQVELSGDGLDFADQADRLNVRLSFLGTGSRACTIIQTNATAGLLAYQRYNSTNGLEWADLPASWPVTITNGTPQTLTLALRRSRMTTAEHNSVLVIKDGMGSRYAIPVSALSSNAGYTGLWVGTVSVNEVSEPHFGALRTNLYAMLNDQAVALTDSRLVLITNQVVRTNFTLMEITTNSVLVVRSTNGLAVPTCEKVERNASAQSPTATASEFTMRLMLHVNAAGQTRLLKEVIQMWRDGTATNDAQGREVVDKPGCYVLVTRDSLLSQFKGASLRDGVAVGRRLSAVGFDFDGQGTNDMALTGAFGPGQALAGTIQIAANYSLNPFLHKYHPDHDNLDANFKAITEAGKMEAYAVTRQLLFQFGSGLRANSASPDPAYSSIDGTYSETLTGLHKLPLLARGAFHLTRASYIAELNPSTTP